MFNLDSHVRSKVKPGIKLQNFSEFSEYFCFLGAVHMDLYTSTLYSDEFFTQKLIDYGEKAMYNNLIRIVSILRFSKLAKINQKLFFGLQSLIVSCIKSALFSAMPQADRVKGLLTQADGAV